MELNNILISPVITEKSTNAQTEKKYSFLVDQRATKIEIQQAVEKAYNTKVAKVNIIPVLKKVRQIGRGRTMTKRRAAKKAVITLKEGSIDFNKIKTS